MEQQVNRDRNINLHIVRHLISKLGIEDKDFITYLNKLGIKASYNKIEEFDDTLLNHIAGNSNKFLHVISMIKK